MYMSLLWATIYVCHCRFVLTKLLRTPLFQWPLRHKSLIKRYVSLSRTLFRHRFNSVRCGRQTDRTRRRTGLLIACRNVYCWLFHVIFVIFVNKTLSWKLVSMWQRHSHRHIALSTVRYPRSNIHYLPYPGTLVNVMSFMCNIQCYVTVFTALKKG